MGTRNGCHIHPMTLRESGNGALKVASLLQKSTNSIPTTRFFSVHMIPPETHQNGKRRSGKLGQGPLILAFILNLACSLRSTTYSIPIVLQVRSCLRRGAQRLRNVPGPVIGGIFANAILALVVGSVYYNLPMTSDSMDKRAVLIFFSLLVTAFSPAFEVRPNPPASGLTWMLN